MRAMVKLRSKRTRQRLIEAVLCGCRYFVAGTPKAVAWHQDFSFSNPRDQRRRHKSYASRSLIFVSNSVCIALHDIQIYKLTRLFDFAMILARSK